MLVFKEGNRKEEISTHAIRSSHQRSVKVPFPSHQPNIIYMYCIICIWESSWGCCNSFCKKNPELFAYCFKLSLSGSPGITSLVCNSCSLVAGVLSPCYSSPILSKYCIQFYFYFLLRVTKDTCAKPLNIKLLQEREKGVSSPGKVDLANGKKD